MCIRDSSDPREIILKERARQMTRIFCDDAFTGFERRGGRKQVHYVCMAEYDATMPLSLIHI